MVSERAPSLTKQRGISRLVQKPAPLGEKAGDGHRTDASVALEHLDKRVLHREPQNLLALLAEQLGNRLHHAAFARPGYALDRYDPVTR